MYSQDLGAPLGDAVNRVEDAADHEHLPNLVVVHADIPEELALHGPCVHLHYNGVVGILQAVDDPESVVVNGEVDVVVFRGVEVVGAVGGHQRHFERLVVARRQVVTKDPRFVPLVIIKRSVVNNVRVTLNDKCHVNNGTNISDAQQLRMKGQYIIIKPF